MKLQFRLPRLNSLKVRLTRILRILRNKRVIQVAHQSTYPKLGPSPQDFPVSHAEIQKHLRGPLGLDSGFNRDQNIVVETSETEDLLFAACILGDVIRFKELIRDE